MKLKFNFTGHEKYVSRFRRACLLSHRDDLPVKQFALALATLP